MCMRVLIADDRAEVRSGLRLLLEQEPGSYVVAEVAEPAALLAAAREFRPDALLVDWELPGREVADLLPLVRSACPGLRVVAMSGRPEVRKAALAAGADAFISKGEEPARVLATLRSLSGRGRPPA